jgi:transcriptional regulator with XRE-family HTH domain
MKIRGEKLQQMLANPLVRQGFDMQQARRRAGALLRRKRLDRGLTQKDVEELSHIDQANISKYEAGTLSLQLDTYVRLMHAQGYAVRIEAVPLAKAPRRPEDAEGESYAVL